MVRAEGVGHVEGEAGGVVLGQVQVDAAVGAVRAVVGDAEDVDGELGKRLEVAVEGEDGEMVDGRLLCVEQLACVDFSVG